MAGAVRVRPLILAAELGAEDFAWLDGLRRRHYPVERNRVPAHLTIFHVLPPSAESEIRSRLAGLVARPAPAAWVDGVMDLGGGVAFRVVSPELDAIRGELLEVLHGLLGAQDARGWRPHVTIQNKVAPSVARELKSLVEQGLARRPLRIRGLSLHYYDDGSWKPAALYPFRG